jgi:hypothetical protein
MKYLADKLYNSIANREAEFAKVREFILKQTGTRNFDIRLIPEFNTA